MSFVPLAITCYLVLTLGLGWFAGRRVTDSNDFCLASQQVPLLMCATGMFSTWFGAETIVAAPGEFLAEGMIGIIEDPLGTTLCFLLIGAFFARAIYQNKFLTLSSLITERFGTRVGWIYSLLQVLTNVGWVGAQFVAMAMVLQITTGIPLGTGMWLSAFVICTYTVTGGMWSLAYNDLLQSVVIVLSLGGIFAWTYASMPADFSFLTAAETLPIPHPLRLLPSEHRFWSWSSYLSSWIAVSVGSLAGQEIYQRVLSARSAATAQGAAYLSALFYIVIGIMPILLTLMVRVQKPDLVSNSELFLLDAVHRSAGTMTQVLFFGALLSAIMSSASGGLIAISVTVADSLVKPRWQPRHEQSFLFLIRASVVGAGIVSVLYAQTNPHIFHLMLETSAVSTAALFVPFCVCLFVRNPQRRGAEVSMMLGCLTWAVCLALGRSSAAPVLCLASAALGYLLGHRSVTGRWRDAAQA